MDALLRRMDGGLPETRDSSPSDRYKRRDPVQSLLYRTIASNLETFLARQQQRSRPVPRFVEDEFRKFLQCGVLEYGFLRLRCETCGLDRLLAFSCKCRGFCPSCGGRRMADTAAHLVDRVIPEVPVRQWVLSLPYAVRYRVAFDGALLGKVLGIFIRAVFASLRRRARDCGIPGGQCGAVTFVQRFGSDLKLMPHFHSLVFDGVYAAQPGEHPRFYPLRPPEKRDVEAVAARGGAGDGTDGIGERHRGRRRRASRVGGALQRVDFRKDCLGTKCGTPPLPVGEVQRADGW